jgi:bacterioferritin-associated ferredoxin
MCWAVLCFALNTGHAAAELRLPLVNACLSAIADDKVVQVIQYSCFNHYQIVHKSGVGSVCMLCVVLVVAPTEHLPQAICIPGWQAPAQVQLSSQLPI